MDLGYFETALNVQDIRRSLDFYEALGFEKTDGDVDIRCVTVRRADCGITLYQGQLEPPRTQLIFWQGGVEAIWARLSAQGVTCEPGSPKKADDGGRAVMLHDPDGHPIYIINMPVHFVNDPAYAREEPPYVPSRPAADPRLGWYELSLDVADVDRSVGYYRKFGFERVDDGAVASKATLQNGDCRISVYRGHFDAPEPQLMFWQGDVAGVARELAGKGLNFKSGPSVNADGHVMATLKDPDGHSVVFINIPGMERREAAGAG